MKYLMTRNNDGGSLMRDIDRIWNDFFDDLPGWNTSLRTPAVDVREETDRYVLEAELPGLTEQDIDVKVEDNLLTISSKKEEEREGKESGYVLRERRAAAFSRSFVLPRDVDREKITAKFRNGLLELTIDKKEESKPKSIQIKVE